MKRVWGHVLGGVSLVAGGGILIAACKHDDSTLFVQDVLQAPLVTAGQQCTFTSDPTQPFISSGILDIGIRSEYDATFLIGNQAVAEVNSQQLQTETDIITVQGAIVRITDAAGNQLANFTRLAAATVYPSSGSVPGYSPITVTIVDQNTLQGDTSLLQNVSSGGTSRLVTYTKFFGNTTGGRSVESDEFAFPVDVCYGCLVVFSATDQSNATGVATPNCLLAGASSASSQPSPCVIGQDFDVDCSECQSAAVCRGAYATLPVPDAGTD